MNQAERDQLITVLSNLESQKQYIPFLSDLMKHPTFGPIFSNLDQSQQDEINQIIDWYMTDKIKGLGKTKWGQLFQRFFEGQEELFWLFRDLNEYPEEDPEQFQRIGKQVEHEMFKLEGILTEKMVGQEKGLDKVVSSFYTIVYSFFPRLSEIE